MGSLRIDCPAPQQQAGSLPAASLRLLLVQDSQETGQGLLQSLQRAGVAAAFWRVHSAEELRAALARARWDAVICDFELPHLTGLAALAIVREVEPDAPFILVSGAIGEESAVAAIKAGASDLVTLRNLTQLAPALQRALSEAQRRAAERTSLRELMESEQQFRDLTALSSDWYWEQDENFRFTLVSSGARGDFSKAFASWAGKAPWELPYHNVDWTEHKATLQAHRAFHDLELQPVTPDGSVTHVSVSGEPRFGADGEFRGYHGVGTDVSVRRNDDRRRFQAMDAMFDAILLVDRSTMRVVYVNDAGCRLRELARGQILAMEPWNVWGEQAGSRAALERIYDSLIAGGGVSEPQEFLWRPDQASQQWLDIRRQAYRLRDRWTIIILVRDISERKAAEQKLKRLNRLYAMVSGVNALVLRARDRDELFRDACRIAVEHGEFDRAWVGIVDQAGDYIVPIAFAGMDEETIAAIKQLFGSRAGSMSGTSFTASAIRKKAVVVSNDMNNDPRVLITRTKAPQGNHSLAVFPLLVAANPIGVLVLRTSKAEFFDEQGIKLLTELAGNIAFAVDYIDKRERLDYLAYYDALTGLANRRLFLERLAQYLRSAASGRHKSALFVIDLERFKSINDSLGRAAGDSLLQQVAHWLTRFAGDANLLARVGADQFAIVLPLVNPQGDLSRFLDRAVTAFLNHPFTLNESTYRIAAKAGVVLYPEDGSDADTLFKHAEAALKKAKVSGDRYLFYAQRMSETLSGRLDLENQLRQALDNEEFVLHFQPKVNLVSGKLTGAEALIRWNSPQTGLVPPGRFIPILEQTGLIHEVGRWALRTAIDNYLRWRASGLPVVPIAVNVSPLQLRNRGFVAEIAQAISVDPHAAEGLQLELTESLIMEDVEHSITSLQALRAMGISIAIDDFGTGFSSLSYLSKLPMDTLKIDRSFVLDMTSGPAAATLVSVIINLAHALKLNAVAEGVETQEQLQLLRSLDCDEVQGYLCGRPVPGAIFESQFLSLSGSDASQIQV